MLKERKQTHVINNIDLIKAAEKNVHKLGCPWWVGAWRGQAGVRVCKHTCSSWDWLLPESKQRCQRQEGRKHQLLCPKAAAESSTGMEPYKHSWPRPHPGKPLLVEYGKMDTEMGFCALNF